MSDSFLNFEKSEIVKIITSLPNSYIQLPKKVYFGIVEKNSDILESNVIVKIIFSTNHFKYSTEVVYEIPKRYLITVTNDYFKENIGVINSSNPFFGEYIFVCLSFWHRKYNSIPYLESNAKLDLTSSIETISGSNFEKDRTEQWACVCAF